MRSQSSNSNAPLVHYYAGLLYLKLGKRDEAMKEFERELVLNPNDIQPKYSLADIFLAGKNVERGLALIREVVAGATGPRRGALRAGQSPASKTRHSRRNRQFGTRVKAGTRKA